ncbi:putative high affinity copper protein [Biscogniauxia mediterranea]|nr:putative high affinity copper protein [Biscogniauxia mediterranea]
MSPTTADAIMSSTGANWTATPTPMAAGMMDGKMGSMMHMGGCRVSMLWNWYTIDACFLAPSWRIRSYGAFAGLCIGMILLVMLLEFVRLVARTYDRHLIRQHRKTVEITTATASGGNNNAEQTWLNAVLPAYTEQIVPVAQNPPPPVPVPVPCAPKPPTAPFRPSVYEQAVRALLHTLQFVLAYLIMLMAMYYNGYIIICITIGAFFGAFVCQWERLGIRDDGPARGVGHCG